MHHFRWLSTLLLSAFLCLAGASGQELLQDKPEAAGRSNANRESVTTADFSRVTSLVKGFVSKYGREQVLLVVDIDNTLLAMNQPLGSDQWFNWQSELLKMEPASHDLVAKTFAGLLEVQGTLFALSGMHSPEPDLPKLIREIQAWGVTTTVLTSRGPNFRDAAERELLRNGYDFDSSALRIREKRGLFMPFDPSQPTTYGLTTEIAESLKGRLSPVTYSNGIYMTSGQHKVYMLKTLLARSFKGDEPSDSCRSFRAIVFVDDHEKHTQRMHEAFADSDMDLATVRYSREDGNVSNFKSSSKRHVVDDWERLRSFIKGVLVK